MKKITKLTAVFAAVVMFVLSVCVVNVAAASSTIAVSSKSVQIGQSIVFTLTINGGEAMYATEADFNYDPAVLKFISGDSANGSNGSVHIVGTPGGATKQSYSLTFTALAVGSCTVSMTNVKYVGNDEVAVNGSSVPGITVKASQPVLSNDANLASLTLSTGKLSPAFSAATTNYTATVNNDVEKITINAKANAGATVAGNGSISLKVGTNKHTVTVTAADGTKKSYVISIKRLDKQNTSSNDTASNNENDTSSKDNASETETPTEDIPTADVLAVFIGGKPYHVLSELPESPVAPLGFEISESEYNGAKVAVYTTAEKEYTLYIIKNDEDSKLDFYTYDSLRDDFILLPYVMFNNKMFILATPSDTAVAPDGYSETELTLGNTTVRAYQHTSDEMRDFYIFYAFVDGEFKFYSYDTVEKTVQRAPDFKLLEIEDTDVSVTPDKSVNSILKWFEDITLAGKAVVLIGAVIVICILAIIILLIIRAVKRPRFLDGDGILFEPEEEFDEVKVVSPFVNETEMPKVNGEENVEI